MQNPGAIIHCSNPRCQAPNPLENKICQKCNTPLLKRYLWAIGRGIETYSVGDLIHSRYWLIAPRIFLDTQPTQLQQNRCDLPQEIVAYLKLAPYRLHIPQVYGALPVYEQKPDDQVWLLEYSPLIHENIEYFGNGTFLPELTKMWSQASPLRQLNWLWQIAKLWQPLMVQGVAGTLLNPSLLWVNGSIVQLRELYSGGEEVFLGQLGEVWSEWVPYAHPAIANFLESLCLQLSQSQLNQPEQLILRLDYALRRIGQSQTRSYQIFTQTDQGPGREHNEDACYPFQGELINTDDSRGSLGIVCDGIGGHEGGEIASHLAIESIQERVQRLFSDESSWNPTLTTLSLESAVCDANDQISDRNDSEKRHERQRMGTTLVMTLADAHQIYLTHVGDSRIYWITSTACHQVTFDDDLASREVRLGYSLHRDAISHPSSGALVQALGMGTSKHLRPTVQRITLDEDGIFLLCSDGLSDYDRVEQYWRDVIYPLLKQETDIKAVGKRLIEIANTKNGHDNVSVALVYCQVQSSLEETIPVLSLSKIESELPMGASHFSSGSVPTEIDLFKPNTTTVLPPQSSSSSPWKLLWIIILLGITGGLAYWFWPDLGKQLLGQSSSFSDDQSSSASEAVSSVQREELQVGDRFSLPETIIVFPAPQDLPEESFSLPPQTIVQVQYPPIQKETDISQESWLSLLVCQLPSTDPLPSSIVAEFKTGWIQREVLTPLIPTRSEFLSTDSALGSCSTASPEPQAE